MARFQHYRCPDCSGIFKHMHVLSTEGPPDRCPLCGSWMNIDEPPAEVFVPTAPGIRKSALAKSEDQTYRAMETSSAERAEEAADMLGVSKSEMSHLKITDMRTLTEMREGDTAVKIPSTAAALLSGGSQPGFQALAGAVPNHAPGVADGMGNVTRENVTGQHSTRAAVMTARGNMGRYSGRD